MAKKSASTAAQAAIAKPQTSEAIDDIFACKPKPKTKPTSKPAASSAPVNATASSSRPPTEPPKKKKKRSHTIPAFIPDDAHPTEPESGRKSKKAKLGPESTVTPSRAVEEVLDPSIPRPTAPAAMTTTNAKASVGLVGKGGKKREKRTDAVEDDDFADSRGIGPRRQTEEGFLIYKEAELKINPEAGGTPLCPFDCDCCF